MAPAERAAGGTDGLHAAGNPRNGLGVRALATRLRAELILPTDRPANVDETRVLDVHHDSRQVSPHSLFCCVRGAQVDGHQLADAAVAAGAVALVVDHELDLGVPQLVVDDVRAAVGPAAAAVWGDPSHRLTVMGVTGTNGKTTVVTLCAQLLDALGHNVRSIGTLTGARTTPEGSDLQRSFAALLADDVTHVAMEVSSHALDLHRVDGTRFAVTAFTNLGRDHLDHHVSIERYFAAKARLFEPGWAEIAVVNIDDVRGRLIRDTAVVVGSPEIDAVELAPLGVSVSVEGAAFTWRGHEVRSPLRGRFNVTNLVIALESCVVVGADPAALVAAVGRLSPPPGRLEPVAGAQALGFEVLVDYAHTPDAMTGALEACRELASGRLIVVAGAGGDRDRGKRAPLGAAMAEAADVVVITSDNPRSESPSAIMAEVAAGIRELTPTVIEDRAAAIAHAVNLAEVGDLVLIAGKGHEQTQTIGDTVVDFDDRRVAAAALAARAAGACES